MHMRSGGYKAYISVNDIHNFMIYSIFFESVTWDELTVGYDHVPGGPEFANRSVLSWHFYIPPLVGHIIVVILTIMQVCRIVSVVILQVSATLSFFERQKDIERLNCAGMLLIIVQECTYIVYTSQ